MVGILGKIIEHTREVVAQAKRERPEEEVRSQAADGPPVRDFRRAITRRRGEPLRLIAELKKASPSRGLIRQDFVPEALARVYAEHGAAAVSVLTEERHFQGALEYLDVVRQTVGIPILRKDFIVDPYQVYEARAHGADAVLLIASALSGGEIEDLQGQARGLGMEALVEIHDEEDLARAVAASARIIGVNNRDLKTLSIDLAVTEGLLPGIPADATVVTESGIGSRSDVERFLPTRVDAMLVGTTLMQSSDVGGKIRNLLGTLPD